MRLGTDIKYYVDEDLVGFGHSMMWARTDTVTCGAELVAEELPRGVLDQDWIPIVAAHRWIAISGNDKIHISPIEARVAMDCRARIVCLHDEKGDLSTWGKLRLLTRWWDRIEAFIDTHPMGPWWYSVTASGPRELPYRPPEGIPS